MDEKRLTPTQLRFWFKGEDITRIKQSLGDGETMRSWVEQAIQTRLETQAFERVSVPKGEENIRLNLDDQLLRNVEAVAQGKDVKIWIKEAIYQRLSVESL